MPFCQVLGSSISGLAASSLAGALIVLFVVAFPGRPAAEDGRSELRRMRIFALVSLLGFLPEIALLNPAWTGAAKHIYCFLAAWFGSYAALVFWFFAGEAGAAEGQRRALLVLCVAQLLAGLLYPPWTARGFFLIAAVPAWVLSIHWGLELRKKAATQVRQIMPWRLSAALAASVLGFALDLALTGRLQEIPVFTLMGAAMALLLLSGRLQSTSPGLPDAARLATAALMMVLAVAAFTWADGALLARGEPMYPDRRHLPLALGIAFAAALIYAPLSSLAARAAGGIGARIEAMEALADERQRQAREQRRHVAEDIHDNITQEIYAAKLQLHVIEKQIEGASPEMKPDLETLKATVSEALKNSRLLLERLRRPPEYVDDDDEAMAAEAMREPLEGTRRFLERIQNQTGIAIASDGVENLAGLPIDLARDLASLIRESVNNTRKHASAGRIRIRLKPGKARLSLLIADDGRGFDAGKSHMGFGLASMADRSRRRGLAFSVRSVVGKGTAVLIRG